MAKSLLTKYARYDIIIIVDEPNLTKGGFEMIISPIKKVRNHLFQQWAPPTWDLRVVIIETHELPCQESSPYEQNIFMLIDNTGKVLEKGITRGLAICPESNLQWAEVLGETLGKGIIHMPYFPK